MKKSFSVLITFLTIITILLSGTAYSEEPRRDIIIGFHQMPIPSEKALIYSEGGFVKHEYRLIPAVSASLSEQAIDDMRKNPRVAYIEDDVILTIATDEYVNSTGVSHIGCEIAHNNGIGGTGVKVAVIDTGVDYTHEDLDANYKGGYDFVFNDPDPFEAYNSHGTHVAGVIAAERNNVGVVGVAPNVSLYAVRVLDSAGFGTASWVIAGIEWAVYNDMDVVVMSLGTSVYSQSLRDACCNASGAGVLLVAAAGNTYGGNVTYPARYDSVMAVTATYPDDNRASLSPIGQEVELAAPGVNIRSTFVGGSSYGNLSGTSQAAPHVAGTAALIISSNLSDVNDDGVVNNEDVRLQLQSMAQDLGDPGKDDVYGYGLVDARITADATSCDCGGICVSTSGWWRDGGAFNASGTPVQAAVDTATAGETICVKNGSYFENVDVARDHLTIRSEAGSVSTIVQAANPGDHVFEVVADYVNISGFGVAGATGTSGAGIYLNGADHCNISDNTASCNENGICLKSSSNNILLNNTASNNDNCGINLCDSSDNLIYNNYWGNTNNACDDGSNRWNITTITAKPNIIGGPSIGGNYWSNYNGTDTDGDGLGEETYNIGSGNFDYHPLYLLSSVKGDLNGDGAVTPADATIALHLVATGAHDDTADVSGDGQVTSLDALTILQAAAGMVEL